MALIGCLLYNFILKSTKRYFVAELIAGIFATLVMAIGYFVYETLFFVSVSVSIISLPYNLLQGIVGTVIAILIMRIIVATKILDKLQK